MPYICRHCPKSDDQTFEEEGTVTYTLKEDRRSTRTIDAHGEEFDESEGDVLDSYDYERYDSNYDGDVTCMECSRDAEWLDDQEYEEWLDEDNEDEEEGKLKTKFDPAKLQKKMIKKVR